MTRSTVLAIALLPACSSPVAPPVAPVPARIAAEPDTEMARDQLFFASGGSDPTLLAVILQRVKDRDGASIEAKAFVVWDGVWRSPFWERVAVPKWPGIGVAPALAAWEADRGGKALRVAWTDGADGLHVGLRSPDVGVSIDAPALTDAGHGMDPHGAVAWRTGAAQVTLNGAVRSGIVVAETLSAPAIATPRFGQFEMWLAAPAAGELTLGRRGRSTDDPGEALRVTGGGATVDRAFPIAATSTRPDAESGYALPDGWQMGEDGPRYARIAGEIGRGRGPDGQPAAYDVSYAHAIDGVGAALVFHLQDADGSASGGE